MPKDNGISRAIAVIGPIPGSTPTIVPTSTPMNAKNRLYSVSASRNPPPRPENRSIANQS